MAFKGPIDSSSEITWTYIYLFARIKPGIIKQTKPSKTKIIGRMLAIKILKSFWRVILILEKLNKIELAIASKIAPKLKERGILIAGLDIVGDFLTEINITCPTCFRELLDKKGINLMEEVFNFVES